MLHYADRLSLRNITVSFPSTRLPQWNFPRPSISRFFYEISLVPHVRSYSTFLYSEIFLDLSEKARTMKLTEIQIIYGSSFMTNVRNIYGCHPLGPCYLRFLSRYRITTSLNIHTSPGISHVHQTAFYRSSHLFLTNSTEIQKFI